MSKKTNLPQRGRGIYLLPNLFTIGALFAGFYAIVAALKGRYEDAAIAIFIAMLMDSLDGRVARLTHTETPFGAELDSLSDMVAFGVAPALVIYSWALINLGKFGWLAAFVFTAAVALRLARFNTQVSKSKRYFQGIPCTPAAGVVAGIVWAGKDLVPLNQFSCIIIASMIVLVGALMVSNIRFRSFKDFDFREHVPFVVILSTVLILVCIALNPPFVLFAVFTIYALSGPIATIWELRKRKQLRQVLKKKISQHD